MSRRITVIDYGMGNIRSVLNAIEYLGIEPRVCDAPEGTVRSDFLILPGVGSFRKAMLKLRETGLDQAIVEAVCHQGRQLLGICLGMQLLARDSDEDGMTEGLGLIDCSVRKFTAKEVDGHKVPHVGFNSVRATPNSKLFGGLPDQADFYFVHSFRLLPDGLSGQASLCRYGIDFLAAYEQGNLFATQFHPEKSQVNGLMLLKNFLDL